jgi:hypothetical protein
MRGGGFVVGTPGWPGCRSGVLFGDARWLGREYSVGLGYGFGDLDEF